MAGKPRLQQRETLQVESDGSLQPTTAELERMFDAFTPLFKREMKRPVISIQSRGRRRALGWFWDRKWQNGQETALPEINICAENLHAELHDIAETMIHEMCHYVNALEGISDCSPNQYHNGNFRDRCLAVGLHCEKMPGRGWARTSLTEELRRLVDEQDFNPGAFQIFRKSPAAQQKAVTKMKKWRCACTNIRAAVEVDATCNKCGQPFLLQEVGV
jgi:hypothetical protein